MRYYIKEIIINKNTTTFALIDNHTGNLIDTFSKIKDAEYMCKKFNNQYNNE